MGVQNGPPPSPPSIAPRRSDGAPLWSVVIPVHNCADLLDVALRSVLDQVGGRSDVEIIVVDDGSVDHPETVVEALDPHGRVRFERNDVALGAVANFNHCLRSTSGELVHLLHGDDLVHDGFYDAMASAFENAGVIAAVCRTQYVDDAGVPGATTRSERNGTGRWSNAAETLAISNRVRPAAVVVRREAYERVGGFREDLPHAADWEMWMRLAVNGDIWFVDETLAGYRVHDASDTAARVRSGTNIRERRDAIRIVASHLPEEHRRSAMRKALVYSAAFAGRSAVNAVRRRDLRTARAQLRESGTSLVEALRTIRRATPTSSSQ